MKYIRTKDGIFDTSIWRYDKYSKCYFNKKYRLQDNVYQNLIYKDEIIKQANTVEELCDLFAYNKTFVGGQMLQEIKRYYGTRYQGILYAYTFGENGDIIKVAKMNAKGELELL